MIQRQINVWREGVTAYEIKRERERKNPQITWKINRSRKNRLRSGKHPETKIFRDHLAKSVQRKRGERR